MKRVRPIDRRPVPAVAGIDLEHALNYLDIDDAGIDFMYRHYTSSHLMYRRGARPALEQYAREVVRNTQNESEKISALARWVAVKVRWAGYYRLAKCQPLPADRNLNEEQLIKSGFAWCNEQARVFCALSQVIGFPARLVFACNKRRGYGHVISEVLLDAGWLAVDQSLGYCFFRTDKPIAASRIWRDERCRMFFAPRYHELCHGLMHSLGPAAAQDFRMGAAAEPLDGYRDLGYQNYFVH